MTQHTLPHDESNPDPRAGHYYVSAVDGPRYWLLAGPFASHSEALAMVDTATSLAHEHDAAGRLSFAGFGTCRREDHGGFGRLNALLGLATA